MHLDRWAQAKDAGLLGDYVYTASRTSDKSRYNTCKDQQSSYNEAPPTDWRL